MITSEEILKQLENKLSAFENNSKMQNVGVVEKSNDGVVAVSGLSQAVMGEQVTFESGSRGLILNLDEDYASIILLDPGSTIQEGEKVSRTEKLLTVTASEDLLGRVINPLGIPLDGKKEVTKGKDMPLERIAAGVTEREKVDTPMKTGIKAIDAMFPIGRGQRELIIGDRGLGKTAIAIDAILNQKPGRSTLKPMIAIYVAIGQKQSTVAQIAGRLKEEGAMDYSIIVAANAPDPAALQYLAPYAGVAIAEYFMEKGHDVLIVYDDLTKHAWAYRQMSLILKRPAGREAYPGDVFYLHSRLLERAVRLNEKNGGGSITALPIIETQAGDISAYIPTNVISITDGQIFLESGLFNSGFRPAINVGSSVSRVGGDAQTGAMKSVSGKLKLDLAQYRELAAFAQFGSDLDAGTVASLDNGKRMTEILKQLQYHPLSEPEQILSIWAVANGYANDIPVEKIGQFENELHEYVHANNKKLIERLGNGKKVDDEAKEKKKKTVEKFKKGFSI